jgi:hypothetical protein
MPVCEFGERQYELAANLELIAGTGHFFTPTTALEGHLGIDAALTPGDERIWKLLGLSRPGGVTAGSRTFSGWPAGTSAAATPPFLVSLFIQYKRSTLLTRTTAKEWSTHGEQYWRVDLAHHQHQLLRGLEVAVASNAVVRYAAPRFWKHQEMWELQAAGGVLDSSLLIAPGAIQPEHGRISWSEARGAVGHSEPEQLRAEGPNDLALEFIRRARDQRGRERESSKNHLATLADALVELTPSRRPREQWLREVDALYTAPRESRDRIEPFADMALIAEAAHATRTSWLVIALTEHD